MDSKYSDVCTVPAKRIADRVSDLTPEQLREAFVVALWGLDCQVAEEVESGVHWGPVLACLNAVAAVVGLPDVDVGEFDDEDDFFLPL